MAKGLKFGTGGLRGKLGDGPDKMNITTVTRATQGLATYIQSFGEETCRRGVVIAYDCRRMSPEFAEATALCLNANGIPTFVFDSLRPTPELSYAVRFLNCIAGVVITASHNPPEYNGYKVYWEDGAQIVSPHDKGIMGCIGKSEVRSMSRDEAEAAGLFHVVGKEIDEAYYEDVIRQAIHQDVINRMAPRVKVVYTPLHGTGCVPVKEILRRMGFSSVYVVESQAVADGDFPTCEFPNPENPSAFKLALELAHEVDADIVMATDPDADRLGVYVKDRSGACAGTFLSEDEAYPYVRFNGNVSGTLMAEYVCRERSALGTLPADGVVVSTIVSSNMCRRIAEEYGLMYMETLTGFKYVGEKIHEFEMSGEHHFVYGMEESFGCLVGDYTRDKDACGAVVMMCEMAAFYMEKGETLCDALVELYEKYGWYVEGQKSVKYDTEDGAAEMAAVVEGYRNEPPTEIDGRKVVAVRDYLAGTRRVISEGVVLGKDGIGESEDSMEDVSVGNGIKSEFLDLPKSNVIYFELKDDAWMAVRLSGTEPKVKYYWGVKKDSIK